MIFSVTVKTRPLEIGSKSEAFPNCTSWACRKVPEGAAHAAEAPINDAKVKENTNLFIASLLIIYAK
jgi:hypothetical protein